MSKSLITPILFEKDGKKYNLLNIVFGKDNSIYFSFPSKKGRYIELESIKKYTTKDYEEIERTLLPYEKENIEPKVSFHPRNMIVHVNSNISKYLSADYELLNIHPDKNKLFVYLLQILFPTNVDFYDECTEIKHEHYIVVQEPPKDEIITLEFIIHTTGIVPLEASLPISKARHLKEYYTYESPYEYTYTLFNSTIKSELNNEIILSLNTKEDSCIYKIKNKTE